MRYYTVAIFLSVLLAVACKSPKSTTTGVDTEYSDADKTPEEDCYYPRKTIRTLTAESGAMLEIDGRYLIETDSRGTRYLPCSVPVAYQSVGLRVTFTGDKLEIYQNERLMGTPLRLLSIELEN